MTIASLQSVDILNTDINVAMENDPSYQELKQNITQAVEESQELVIVTASDVSTAANYISNFKKITKTAENLRKEWVQPLTDKKSEIDSFFKKIPLMFSGEQDRLEKEMLDFKRKADAEAKKKADEERKRLEDEAIQKGIIEEERRKKEAEEKGIPFENIIPVQPAIIPEVIPQTKKISEMNTSKVSTRRTKTFTITNEGLIPREYLIVDEKKIRAERMKYDFEAKSTIPGVIFTFDESVV